MATPYIYYSAGSSNGGGGTDAVSKILARHPDMKVSRRGGSEAYQFAVASRAFYGGGVVEDCGNGIGASGVSLTPPRQRFPGPQPLPVDDPELLPQIAPQKIEDLRKDDAIQKLSLAPNLVDRIHIAHALFDAHLALVGFAPTSGEKALGSGRKVCGAPVVADDPRREGVKKRPENYDAYQVEGMVLKETFKQDGKLSSNRLLFNPLTGESTSMMLPGQLGVDAASSPYAMRRSSGQPPLNNGSSSVPGSSRSVSQRGSQLGDGMGVPSPPRQQQQHRIYSDGFSAEPPTAPADGTFLFRNPLTGQELEYSGTGPPLTHPTTHYETKPTCRKVVNPVKLGGGEDERGSGAGVAKYVAQTAPFARSDQQLDAHSPPQRLHRQTGTALRATDKKQEAEVFGLRYF